MQPRTICLISVVLVGSGAFAFFAFATPIANTEAPTSEEQKVLLDCQHSDYRTYIKCLKRHKRHHLQHGDYNHGDFDSNCLESCLKKCDAEHECDRKCSHCLRKTKHKHQIITEYETECIAGECTNKSNNNTVDNLRSTNITTKIDIRNIINSGNTTSCCPTCKPPIPCPHPPYPPFPPHPPSPPHLPFPPHLPSSSNSLFQLGIVPQISLGIGLVPSGGCPYPYQWPCPPSQPIDCSGCGTPYVHYKCDVSCYAAQGGQPPNSNSPIPCTSPYCTGGAQG